MKESDKISKFIAFDLETTGLEEDDEIIEFGGAYFEGDELKKTYSTLVNPNKPVPKAVLMLTGINDEDIKKAPTIAEVGNEIQNFISDNILVAHNAQFDLSFIQKEVSFISNITLDTLELSRILLPFITNHKLATLYKFFYKDEPNFHRALDDAVATGNIFLKLKEIIEKLPKEIIKKILIVSNQIEGNTSHLLFEKILMSSSLWKLKDYKNTCKDLFTIPENVYDFIPQNKSPVYKPTEKGIEDIFTKDKGLKKIVKQYEKRSEQVELAKRIIKAFINDKILISEAGTGTGKTFAYLVPAIVWSKFFNERILISTYTKNLEEQLFYKDIKSIAEGLNLRFKATLLKGRNNYLCLKRWEEMFTQNLVALNEDEKKSLLSLIVWQGITKTGDISENSGFWLRKNTRLWSKLSCDTIECEKSECPYFEECYLTKVRKEAMESNIVVINHSLLLSDLIAKQKILGGYSRLIIDEVHNLEKAATDFLGTTINSWQVANLLDRLYSKNKGILLLIKNSLSFINKNKSVITQDEINGAIETVTETKNLFKMICRIIKDNVKKSAFTGKVRLKGDNHLYVALNPLNSELYSNAQRIINLLEKFMNYAENSKITGKKITENLKQIHNEFLQTIEGIHNILSCEEETNCCWVETYSESENVRFLSAPIVVSSILKEKLFQNLQSAVLLSATVLVENSFDYFKERIGLSEMENTTEFASDSSFDFSKQTLVIIPSFVANPQQSEFFFDVTDIIRKIILATRKGTLILFTSYNLLNRVYRQLVNSMQNDNIMMLAQGISGSRYNITKEFKEVKDSILLGTYSFWEGFDVPGEALETLFITKLPFPSPKEPIIEAKEEFITALGMDPFEKLYIPEAIIKLRQGFGRLIRKKDDRGIIVILDNRLVKKRYGRKFLNSLPTKAVVTYSEEELLEVVKRFWSE